MWATRWHWLVKLRAIKHCRRVFQCTFQNVQIEMTCTIFGAQQHQHHTSSQHYFTMEKKHQCVFHSNIIKCKCIDLSKIISVNNPSASHGNGSMILIRTQASLLYQASRWAVSAVAVPPCWVFALIALLTQDFFNCILHVREKWQHWHRDRFRTTSQPC